MVLKTSSESRKLFQLAQLLPPAELRWLRDALNRPGEQKHSSPPAKSAAGHALQATFGMWAGREDIPADGVDYVDEIRRSTRWDDLGLNADEIA